MAETIEIMIVDESHETRKSIKEMIGRNQGIEVIGEARNGREALHRLGVITPSVILMGVPENISDSIKDMEDISLQFPKISIVVLSVHRDWHYVRQYMRAGAKDYLYIPVTQDILVSTIEEVYRMDKESHRRSTEAVLSDQYTQQEKVLSFFSSKGGVGKTTLAVNVAVALALQGKKTVLIDLDLQSGMANILLNINPQRTISDLTNDMNDIDPELLARYLIKHESGLAVLCAPKRPEEMELIKPADIRVIVQSLQRGYDYIILDTSPTVNDILLTALELADENFMVSTLNLAVLRNNRTLLELLKELNFDLDKIKHVINRANVKNGITVQDAVKALNGGVFWELQDDYRFVETAANEGVPFVIRDKYHRLSKQIITFVQKLEQENGKQVTRRNSIRKLFARRG